MYGSTPHPPCELTLLTCRSGPLGEWGYSKLHNGVSTEIFQNSSSGRGYWSSHIRRLLLLQLLLQLTWLGEKERTNKDNASTPETCTETAVHKPKIPNPIITLHNRTKIHNCKSNIRKVRQNFFTRIKFKLKQDFTNILHQ
jgi:hypothetical protein